MNPALTYWPIVALRLGLSNRSLLGRRPFESFSNSAYLCGGLTVLPLRVCSVPVPPSAMLILRVGY